MPDGPDATTTLHAAMLGIVALVLDADGVIILKGEPLPGAPEALRELERREIPYHVVTNFSLAHRSTLATRFAERGTTIDPNRIITAASATAAYTAEHFAGRDIFALVAPDARREFSGQRLVSLTEAEADPASVAAVVIGDAGDDLSFANLDVAFRLIRSGAAFLAMHRNPWWLTPNGPTLDAGAAVVGLEFATGQKATILGKPSPVVFRQALALSRHDLGRRVRPSAVAMVGDDPDADIRGAQRVGLRGFLVLTGKTQATDLPRIRARHGRPPDAIAASLAEIVAALD